MKIYGIHNIKDFFKAIDSCKGKVEIITSAGDRLNLRSKLCQYIALSDIFHDASIGEIEISFENTDDASKILGFLMTEVQ